MIAVDICESKAEAGLQSRCAGRSFNACDLLGMFEPPVLS